MTLFQILALSFVGIVFLATLLIFVRGRFARRDALLWSCVWAAAAVAIWWPQLTANVARALGIGRGADLVLYCAVVCMMVGFLMVYARLRRLRRDVTLLVRHVALMDAERTCGEARSTSSSQ